MINGRWTAYRRLMDEEKVYGGYHHAVHLVYIRLEE